MTKEVYWRDFDYAFGTNGVGNLLVKTNSSSLKQRIRRVLLLEKGDIPFHPEIYTGLRMLPFENFSEGVRSTADTQIRNAISVLEPNVEILNLDIIFEEDTHTLYVSGVFKEKFLEETVEFKTMIGRFR